MDQLHVRHLLMPADRVGSVEYNVTGTSAVEVPSVRRPIIAKTNVLDITDKKECIIHNEILDACR